MFGFVRFCVLAFVLDTASVVLCVIFISAEYNAACVIFIAAKYNAMHIYCCQVQRCACYIYCC